jgi:hypothetical protein
MKLQTIGIFYFLVTLCLLGCDAEGVAKRQKSPKAQILESKIEVPSKDWWRAPLAKAIGSNVEIEVRGTVTSAFGFVCGQARPTTGKESFQRFIVRDADDVLLETKMPWTKFRETLLNDCAMDE